MKKAMLTLFLLVLQPNVYATQLDDTLNSLRQEQANDDFAHELNRIGTELEISNL